MVMMRNSANKRKGHDNETSHDALSRAVVFSPRHSSTNSGNWMDCRGRLDSIMQLCTLENDPILDDLVTLSTLRGKGFSQQLQSKLQQGDAFRNTLRQQIAEANLKLQDESAAAATLREQWQKLVRHAELIKQQNFTLEQKVMKLEKETSKYQELADAEREIMEVTRQQRAKQVPRLQQQLSLYATMTGIKWDFVAQEQMDGKCLVGEVVRHVTGCLLGRAYPFG